MRCWANSSILEEMGAYDPEVDPYISEEIRNWSQLDLAHKTFGGGSLLVMIGIGVTAFVNEDFSGGFVKNICCIHPRRADYVFPRY